MFFIAAGVYIFCGSFYNIFGNAERQAWDTADESTTSGGCEGLIESRKEAIVIALQDRSKSEQRNQKTGDLV